jgi:hypothetical protein
MEKENQYFSQKKKIILDFGDSVNHHGEFARFRPFCVSAFALVCDASLWMDCLGRVVFSWCFTEPKNEFGKDGPAFGLTSRKKNT